MDFTGGRGVDIAFECAVGSSGPVTLPLATLYTRVGGKIVVAGRLGQQIDLDWARIQLSGIKLIPSIRVSTPSYSWVWIWSRTIR